MISISVFIAISALTLFMTYIWLRPNHAKDLPPLPSKPYPIFGNLLDMRNALPLDVFYQWKKQAGDIFSVYFGSKLFVLVANHELLKEMLKKKEDCFFERVEIYFGTFFRSSDGINRFIGNPWKEIRKTTLSIFRDFGMGKEVMAQKIAQEIGEYHKVLRDQKGTPFDVKGQLDKVVTNVVCSVLMGRRYEYSDSFFINVLISFRELSNMMKSTIAIDLFNFLQYLPGDFFLAKKLKAQTEEHFQFFREHNERIKKGQSGSDNDNFMKAYRREVEKAAEKGRGNSLIEDDIVPLSYLLLLTGAESMSATLAWSCVFAMHHPDMQKKIYEEIKENVGLDRLPTTQDRKQLNFVNAYIAEIQRFRNVLPILVPRVCTKTTTLGGYRVPKGALVTSFFDAIQQDKELWGDPEVFRPERFLDADGQFFAPEYHMPYYIGKRACPGEALAVMELFLIITATFQRFEVLPENPTKLPSIAPDHAVTGAPFPFLARLVERVPDKL